MNDIIPVETDNYIQEKNKSADQIAHFLKLFGNGNMNSGLRRTVEMSYGLGEKSGFYKGKECGISIGEKRGVIEGVGVTLSGIAALCMIKFIVEEKKEKQALKTKKNSSLEDTKNPFDDTELDSKSDTHKNERDIIDK